MNKRIEILYDVLNNPYIGINVYPYEIESHITSFKNFINEDAYNLYASKRAKRDGENFHITLFSVPEYNRSKEELSKYIDTQISFNIIGLGKLNRNDNEAFYLIVQSSELNSIRTDNDFKPKDLHITLGFKEKDIFDHKGLDTMVLKL